jgi:hypothetical protein
MAQPAHAVDEGLPADVASVEPFTNQGCPGDGVFFNYLLTQITLGGALLAAMAHGPLLVWIIANAMMLNGFEAWHVTLFGLGYGSALAAALASGARHAKPLTLLTLPLYWPLQSIAVARALYEMKRKPHYWAKTPHGVGRPAPAAAPAAVEYPAMAREDNVIQLPLPF